MDIVLHCLSAITELPPIIQALSQVDYKAPWLLTKFYATIRKHPHKFSSEDLSALLEILFRMGEVNASNKLL